MAFRFDIQEYGAGALAFDAQTYVGGQNTTHDAFIDLFLVPNSTQVYTPAPAGSVQAGGSVINLIATGAQNYGSMQVGAAGVVVDGASTQIYNTTQNGGAVLTIGANATQIYTPVPGAETTQQGAATLTLVPGSVQSYVQAVVVVTSASIAFVLNGSPAKKRRLGLIQEQSSGLLTVNFTNQDGIAATPATVTYRIDDMTTGTVVRAATALSAAPSVAVPLSAVDNAIVDPTHVRELRRVTVEAAFGNGVTVNGQYDYLIRNLSAVE